MKQRAEETRLKPLYALRPLRRRQLHRLLLCLLHWLLLLCLLHWLLLLLLLFPTRLTCQLYLRLELCMDQPHLLPDLLPHGLREVLVELCHNRLEGLR